MPASKVFLIGTGTCAGAVVLVLLLVMVKVLTGAYVTNAVSADALNTLPAESDVAANTFERPTVTRDPALIAGDFYDALMRGDQVEAMACIATPTDKDAKRTIYVLVGQKTSLAALRAAAVKQFGTEAERLYGTDQRNAQRLAAIKNIWRNAAFHDYEETGELVSGSTDRHAETSQRPLRFRMMPDGWKIDGVDLIRDGWLSTGGMSLQANEQKLIARLKLIQEVRKGVYANARLVRDEDRRRWNEAASTEAERLRKELQPGEYKEVQKGDTTVMYLGSAAQEAP